VSETGWANAFGLVVAPLPAVIGARVTPPGVRLMVAALPGAMVADDSASDAKRLAAERSLVVGVLAASDPSGNLIPAALLAEDIADATVDAVGVAIAAIVVEAAGMCDASMAARAMPGRSPAAILLDAAPEERTRPPCAAVGGFDGGGGLVDGARADDGACFVDSGLLLPFLLFAMFLLPPQGRVPSRLCLLDRRCAPAGEPLAVSKAAGFPAKGEDTGGSAGGVEFARPQNDTSPCARCSASVAFEPCSCAWHGPGR